MVNGADEIELNRLLWLIDYLPSDSAVSGYLLGARGGWASADEMALAALNQVILLRRMWASEQDAPLLNPIKMPWHSKKADRMSTRDEIRAFFGANAKTRR